MIEAHQNRIKQLRESFNQKMLEADVWPKKVLTVLTFYFQTSLNTSANISIGNKDLLDHPFDSLL